MDGHNERGRRAGGIGTELKERLSGEQGAKIRARAEMMGKGAIAFFLALLLTSRECMLSTYPLGIAFACSIGGYYIPAFAGSLIGYITGGAGRGYLFSCIAVIAARAVMSYAPMRSAEREVAEVRDDDTEREKISGEIKKGSGVIAFILRNLGIRGGIDTDGAVLYKDKIIPRVVFAAVGGFVAGLFDLVENDLSYYSLYGLLLLCIICPILTYLFCGVFEKDKSVNDARIYVATLSLMVAAVFAAKEKTALGMMLAPMLTVCFALMVTHTRGVFSGCLCALIICTPFSFLYAPLIFLCAVLYALILPVRKSAALATVCAVIVLYCYYFGRTDGLVSVLTPMLFGIPVFLVCERYMELVSAKGQDSESSSPEFFTEAVIEQNKNRAISGRIYALSDAFSSLSKRFYELSDVFHRPDVLHLRDITDESFLSVCDTCRNREICYGADYNRLLDAQAKITSALHTKGYCEPSDIGDRLFSTCIRRERIISEVNSLCAKYTEKIIKGQNTGVFASNYEDVNAVLLDAIKCDESEYECDVDAGRDVFDYLTGLGFCVKGVVVCGKRCKRVTVKGFGLSEPKARQSAKEICAKISDIVCDSMTGPVFEVGNDGTDMIFSSKPRVSVICSHSRRAAFENTGEGEELLVIDPFSDSETERRDECCGDMTGAFITDNSYFYSIICDGMGSGRDAAFVARLGEAFSEKMLCAGNRADITLRMLNNFLRSENFESGKECSVTVDLFELDLMSGSGAFIKSGAASTYILRAGKVLRVSAKTMPIGIIKSPDIKITRFDMRHGDVVVMLSDGCTYDEDSCPWLLKLLCDVKIDEDTDIASDGERIADSIRDSILDESRKNLPSGKHADDISASVVVVI